MTHSRWTTATARSATVRSLLVRQWCRAPPGALAVLRGICKSAAVVGCALLALPTRADVSPCDCLDAYDLASRKREATAAIAGYERAIEQWRHSQRGVDEFGVPDYGAPDAWETSRSGFQQKVIRPQVAAASYEYANRVTEARTNADCSTTVVAQTACLERSAKVHEDVHVQACRLHGGSRWKYLDEYAREEISAYEAELSWVEAETARLERDCRFSLTVSSTVYGETESAESRAEGTVDLHLKDGLLSGDDKLSYDTHDLGPPRVLPTGSAQCVQASKELVRAYQRCIPGVYRTVVGQGQTAIRVPTGMAVRGIAGKVGTFVYLELAVDPTSETSKWVGSRKCMRNAPKDPPTETSFWSDRFYGGGYADQESGSKLVQVSAWEPRDTKGLIAVHERNTDHDWTDLKGLVPCMPESSPEERTRLELHETSGTP